MSLSRQFTTPTLPTPAVTTRTAYVYFRPGSKSFPLVAKLRFYKPFRGRVHVSKQTELDHRSFQFDLFSRPTCRSMTSYEFVWWQENGFMQNLDILLSEHGKTLMSSLFSTWTSVLQINGKAMLLTIPSVITTYNIMTLKPHRSHGYKALLFYTIETKAHSFNPLKSQHKLIYRILFTMISSVSYWMNHIFFSFKLLSLVCCFVQHMWDAVLHFTASI